MYQTKQNLINHNDAILRDDVNKLILQTFSSAVSLILTECLKFGTFCLINSYMSAWSWSSNEPALQDFITRVPELRKLSYTKYVSMHI